MFQFTLHFVTDLLSQWVLQNGDLDAFFFCSILSQGHIHGEREGGTCMGG